MTRRNSNNNSNNNFKLVTCCDVVPTCIVWNSPTETDMVSSQLRREAQTRTYKRQRAGGSSSSSSNHINMRMKENQEIGQMNFHFATIVAAVILIVVMSMYEMMVVPNLSSSLDSNDLESTPTPPRTCACAEPSTPSSVPHCMEPISTRAEDTYEESISSDDNITATTSTMNNQSVWTTVVPIQQNVSAEMKPLVKDEALAVPYSSGGMVSAACQLS